MPAEKPEQRTTRRFSLRLPVSVKYVNGGVHEVAATTKDVSARGVFFYMDQEVSEGSEIEFTLTLPPEITLTESISVRCKGRVVRIDSQVPGDKVGIAAAIEQYDFVAANS